MNRHDLPTAPSPMERRIKELEEEFSYEGYQVVRREFFAHLRDPAITIRHDCITFNAACIQGLENTVYIHILINPDTRRLVVKRCQENDKNALRWCVVHSDKRASRSVSSKRFSAMLYEHLGWDENFRYKILGYRIKAGGEYIYIFDLLEPEPTPDMRKKKTSAPSRNDDTTNKDEDSSPSSEALPASFGTSLEENQSALQLNLRDYRVYDEHKRKKGG